MRKLRLKEKDERFKKFLQLEDVDGGAVASIESFDEVRGTFLLTRRQLGQIREWIDAQQNEFFKKHRVDSKKGKK